MTKHEEIKITAASETSSYPVIGEATMGLGAHLERTGFVKDQAAFDRIRRDALAIVKRCRPFHGPDGRLTGLVVGYVQSGKTVSMTCVSALARDNGCRIVIVLAGVTTLLLAQNEQRFRTDLRGASGRNDWQILNSDRFTDQDQHHLRAAVDEWRDPLIAEEDRRTILIMVLKNHVHLQRLCGLLTNGIDLRGIPALIIDDEADQAGLNTTPDDQTPSTNYRWIERVRQALPHHTYLQYTATPQAPLLIRINDLLSPAFAELVEPGEGYTGGKTFFGAGALPVVRSIPPEDQFKPGAPPSEVPESLLDALRVFFLGAAVASFRGKPDPCSMLVHPSQRKSDHATYTTWISEIVKRWSATLRSKDEEDRTELIAELRAVYEKDLARTDSNLPALETLIPKLILVLGRVVLKEVNSEDGSEVDWDNSATHILVGGEKLNRGFTVNGLTVTYMPRSAGGWNADTLQQRARFFGYKQSYLGLCRLYLHPDVRSAFRDYVIHEESVRSSLAKHRGQPLSEWKRAFFLSGDMKPARRNVLTEESYRVSADKPWFLQRHPHTVPFADNVKRVDDFTKDRAFGSADGYYQHTTAEVALRDLFDQLLLPYVVDAGDMLSWYGQLVTLSDILDNDPSARAVLVQMDGVRERKDDGGSIAIQQGASSAKGKEGAYPGDAKIVDGDRVTLQLHRISVKGGPQGVVAIALHIPSTLRHDVYTQA